MTQEQDEMFRREVARLIATYRDKAGISQTELGERVGVVRLTVWRWETAKREISYRHWTMVAEELRIPRKEWPRRFTTEAA